MHVAARAAVSSSVVKSATHRPAKAKRVIEIAPPTMTTTTKVARVAATARRTSPEPRRLATRAPAAVQKPKCAMKAMTIVWEQMGKASRGWQTSSEAEQRYLPTTSKQISQAHHSLTIITVEGSASERSSSHPSQGLAAAHEEGQDSLWGTRKRATVQKATPVAASAAVMAHAAPSRPMRGVSTARRATLRAMRAKEAVAGAQTTFCATR
mmetsp:Transcript_5983/g.18030  ORF Transcript_5983/g.18030 Transcript_5983/m.18030 type:complete len:210 (+) Transcript_5983:49-678(+)